MNVGKKIKEFREQKGLTVLHLSYAAKISAHYIHSIETRDRNVSIAVLDKIAQALGVHITDLLPPKQGEAA